MAADGGIPVFHHAYEGGAGGWPRSPAAMTAPKKIAGPRTFLLVGDSKLISWANATATAAGQVAFVAPLAASRVPAGLFATLPSGAGTEVDYTARRDAGKAAAARAPTGCWRTTGWTSAVPGRAIRWCTCAGSWCTHRRTPPARPRPER